MRPLLTYKTAAVILDCSASKVQKMCLNREIPILKVGNETRIHPDDLDRWMRGERHFHELKDGRENCRDDKRTEPFLSAEEILAKY